MGNCVFWSERTLQQGDFILTMWMKSFITAFLKIQKTTCTVPGEPGAEEWKERVSALWPKKNFHIWKRARNSLASKCRNASWKTDCWSRYLPIDRRRKRDRQKIKKVIDNRYNIWYYCICCENKKSIHSHLSTPKSWLGLFNETWHPNRADIAVICYWLQ